MRTEKWILLLGIFFADGTDELHAKGLFGSERHCLQFRAVLSIKENWMGRCLTETEFRLRYPSLQPDVES